MCVDCQETRVKKKDIITPQKDSRRHSRVILDTRILSSVTISSIYFSELVFYNLICLDNLAPQRTSMQEFKH